MAATERGLFVVNANSRQDVQREVDYVRFLQGLQVAGLLISPVSELPSALPNNGALLPFVLIGDQDGPYRPSPETASPQADSRPHTCSTRGAATSSSWAAVQSGSTTPGSPELLSRSQRRVVVSSASRCCPSSPRTRPRLPPDGYRGGRPPRRAVRRQRRRCHRRPAGTRAGRD